METESLSEDSFRSDPPEIIEEEVDETCEAKSETKDLKPDIEHPIEHALFKKRTFQEKVEDKLILIDGPSDYEQSSLRKH